MEKIMKSTKLLHKILGILFWGIVVVYVVGALVMFLALVAIKDTAVFDGFPIFIGDYTLLLSKGFTRAQMGQFLWLMFAGYAIFGGLYGYGIRILQGILEPMTQGKPFNTAVSDGLKKLSYAVLVFGVADVILQVAADVVYNKMIDIPSLFAAGGGGTYFFLFYTSPSPRDGGLSPMPAFSLKKKKNRQPNRAVYTFTARKCT